MGQVAHKDGGESMNGNERPDDSNTEPNPAMVWRMIWSWVIDPKHSNAIIAVSTFFILLTNISYTVYSRLQWRASEKAANAAQSAANTARDSLILANRPWIKVVSVTTRDFAGPPPAALTFQRYGLNNTWANLVVSVSIENIGPSVAVNTQIELMQLLPDLAQHDWGKEMLATESAFCANARIRQPVHDAGAVTVFPNDDPFERHWTLAFAINPKLIQHPNVAWAASNQAGWLALSVGGCITYQSAVSREVYQTGFIYDLTGRAKGINGFLGVIPLGADIPSKDLHFDRNEAGYFAQ
jgi:hypothetical protein